ncbi:MAG: chemotaxis protein CheW [Geobacteraceae bacterium]|nr:chemotaxis protein CheW [Geobacteraceae bacterium]
MTDNEILQMVGFSVGDEEFCIDILKVQEIMRLVDITKVPNAPEYVAGLINLRGKVIPIIDFRKRCKLYGGTELDNQHKRIVVTSVGEKTVGLIVDKVSQVLKLEKGKIDPTPDVVKGVNSEFISGVGQNDDTLLILLDLEKLILHDELETIENAA